MQVLGLICPEPEPLSATPCCMPAEQPPLMVSHSGLTRPAGYHVMARRPARNREWPVNVCGWEVLTDVA